MIKNIFFIFIGSIALLFQLYQFRTGGYLVAAVENQTTQFFLFLIPITLVFFIFHFAFSIKIKFNNNIEHIFKWFSMLLSLIIWPLNLFAGIFYITSSHLLLIALITFTIITMTITLLFYSINFLKIKQTIN